jgi:KUP system potassium uptake protein
LHNLKHNKVLHEQTVFLSIVTHDVPTVPREDRVQLEALVNGFYKARCLVRLQGAARHRRDPRTPCRLRYGLAFDVMDTSFFLSRETVIPRATRRAWRCGATTCSRG